MKRLSVLLLLYSTFLGCGGNSPSSPTPSSSTPAPALPPGVPQTRAIVISGSLNFGEVTIGQTASLPMSIFNAGNSALTVSNISLPAGYSADWRNGTIASQTNQAVTIQFTPTAVQTYNGILTVTGDQTSGTNTAAITGAGNISFGGQTSGRILDAQVAQDILVYNENATGGSSFRQRGYITRWELPVPVYVAPGINQQYVRDALEHFRVDAGIASVVIAADMVPRVLVRPGTDGVAAGTSRGLVDGTYSNNRARSGLIVVHPDLLSCTPTSTNDCVGVYVHELTHALGIFDHIPGGVDHNSREVNMLRTLYSLPHGARVQEDGTWQVVLR